MAKFESGKSGNPKGRPKGSSQAQQLRKLLEPHAEELVEKLVSLALAGDIGALKVAIERLVPVLKPAESPIALEGLTGTLADQGRAVLAAVSRGEINTAQAQQLLNGIAAQARIVEVEELEARLSRLEQTNAETPYRAA